MPMGGLEHLLGPTETSKFSEDFVQWMLKDLQTVRQSYKNIAQSPEGMRQNMDRLIEACASIRTRGMRSGYTFASRVATGLSDFCQKYFHPDDPHHLLVAEKHMDTLQAILNANIKGGDNPIGRELMDELQQLVKKYT